MLRLEERSILGEGVHAWDLHHVFLQLLLQNLQHFHDSVLLIVLLNLLLTTTIILHRHSRTLEQQIPEVRYLLLLYRQALVRRRHLNCKGKDRGYYIESLWVCLCLLW